MRILMIHNRYLQRGGEDASFEAEVGLLQKNDSDVVVYEENNERIHDLGPGRAAVRSIWSSEAHGKVRKLLGETRCDIMHVHNFFPLISPSVYFAARAHHVPVVQTLHQYRLLCPVGTFHRDNQVCEDCLGKACAWPGVLHGCYRSSRVASGVVAATMFAHRLARTWTEMVDIYIALTRFGRDKFIKGGLPAERIMVKSNFLLSNSEAGLGGGGYAVFVGRLEVEKGIDTVMRAWEKLAGKIPLRVIGDGSLRLRAQEEAKHIPGVTFLGWRPRAEVLDIVGKAEFLIFPSTWYEGQSMVLIESFSKGTPVIGSRIGSVEEVIEDGRTGLLFNPGDPDDLVAKVNWALAHRAELSSMRAQARLEYQTKYTAERNYQRLMEVYAKAILRTRLAGAMGGQSLERESS